MHRNGNLDARKLIPITLRTSCEEILIACAEAADSLSAQNLKLLIRKTR
jgi:hypothetical protein